MQFYELYCYALYNYTYISILRSSLNNNRFTYKYTKQYLKQGKQGTRCALLTIECPLNICSCVVYPQFQFHSANQLDSRKGTNH